MTIDYIGKSIIIYGTTHGCSHREHASTLQEAYRFTYVPTFMRNDSFNGTELEKHSTQMAHFLQPGHSFTHHQRSVKAHKLRTDDKAKVTCSTNQCTHM